MISSGNAKIRQRKLASGEVVYDLSIVKNYRIHGRGPTSRLLKGLGSIRRSDIPNVAADWWEKTDATLKDLVARRVLLQPCAAKIRRQIEAIIPRAKTTSVTPSVQMTTSSNKEAIYAALAELGITL